MWRIVIFVAFATVSYGIDLEHARLTITRVYLPTVKPELFAEIDRLEKLAKDEPEKFYRESERLTYALAFVRPRNESLGNNLTFEGGNAYHQLLKAADEIRIRIQLAGNDQEKEKQLVKEGAVLESQISQWADLDLPYPLIETIVAGLREKYPGGEPQLLEKLAWEHFTRDRLRRLRLEYHLLGRDAEGLRKKAWMNSRDLERITEELENASRRKKIRTSLTLGLAGAVTSFSLGALAYRRYEKNKILAGIGCREIYERVTTGDGWRLVGKFRSSYPPTGSDQMEVDKRPYQWDGAFRRYENPEDVEMVRPQGASAVYAGEGVTLWLSPDDGVVSGWESWGKIVSMFVPRTGAIPEFPPEPSLPDPGRLSDAKVRSSLSIAARLRAAAKILSGKTPFVHGLQTEWGLEENRIVTDDGRVRLKVNRKTGLPELEIAFSKEVARLDSKAMIRILQKHHPNYTPDFRKSDFSNTSVKPVEANSLFTAWQGNWGPGVSSVGGVQIVRFDPVVIMEASGHIVVKYNPHTRTTSLFLFPSGIDGEPIELTKEMILQAVADAPKQEVSDFDEWVKQQSEPDTKPGSLDLFP